MNKVSLGAIVGQALAVTVGICLAVLVIAGTVKLIMWLFGW